jgi:hypothetical protein
MGLRVRGNCRVAGVAQANIPNVQGFVAAGQQQLGYVSRQAGVDEELQN